mgnify:CR=1 FL=1
MSLIHHIDHIARQPGVLSILVNVPGQTDHRGGHDEALRLAMLMRDELNVDRTSTTTDDITIMVQREPGGTAAIAVVTGHEIRKSLRRMIRRCARAEGRKSDRAAAVDAVILAEDAEVLDAAAAFGV